MLFLIYQHSVYLSSCLLPIHLTHVMSYLSRIDKWATNFGNNIYAVASKATGLTDLQTVSDALNL